MAWREDATPMERAMGELTDALNACVDAEEAASRAWRGVSRRVLELDEARANADNATVMSSLAREVAVGMIGEDAVTLSVATIKAKREADMAAKVMRRNAWLGVVDAKNSGIASASALSPSIITTNNAGA